MENALKEDIGREDITTQGTISSNSKASAIIHAKDHGVICGMDICKDVFFMIDSSIDIISMVTDGQRVRPGQELMSLQGSAASILTGERVALNFLQRLSGISTATSRAVELGEKYGVKILDTRKTTPGLRILEKYAVKVGGGVNHRFCLDDAVLIKDNHIKISGSIEEAVRRVKQYCSHLTAIEIEVETIQQVTEAINCGVDVIMLDNMSYETMKKAVGMIDGRALVEASGGISEDRIKECGQAGVDFISMGSLTHSVASLDISLNIKDTWES